MTTATNRYLRIIEAVFAKRYRAGHREVAFDRSDLVTAAEELGIALPKNLGDVLYSLRYRMSLPDNIVATAPQGCAWIIRPSGRGRYRFTLVAEVEIVPSPALIETKIPDATPGIINLYALNDEQALLAKIRYNRLVDLFTGLTCYSLQNHLRTAIRGVGQVETDEMYIGIDKRGVHFVLPIQANRQSDRIGVVQIEQDIAVCAAKFPGLTCRPIAAQSIASDTVALFELQHTEAGIRVLCEKHYRLVPPDQLTPEEVSAYRQSD